MRTASEFEAVNKAFDQGEIMNSPLKRLAIIALAVSLPTVAILFFDSSRAIGGTTAVNDALYKSKCALCHAADGSGNTAMGKKLAVRDLRSAAVQGQSDAQLSSIIAKGKGKMPGYEKSLSADQVRELVGFIRRLKR
jgi:mono/diheme cytochrome c family protein